MGRRYGYRPAETYTGEPTKDVYRFTVGQRVRRVFNAYYGTRCHKSDEFEGIVVDRYDSTDIKEWWPIYQIENNGDRREFGEVVLVPA